MGAMMKSSNGPSDMTPLPESYEPNDKDVICSWARQNHRHSGNMRFRSLVDEHAPVYVTAETKYEKTKVIADLIEKVRTDSPNGGFIKKDFYSGRWYEIGSERARDKVGHAIRKAADKLVKEKHGNLDRGGKAKSVKALHRANDKTPPPSWTMDARGLPVSRGFTDSHAMLLRAVPTLDGDHPGSLTSIKHQYGDSSQHQDLSDHLFAHRTFSQATVLVRPAATAHEQHHRDAPVYSSSGAYNAGRIDGHLPTNRVTMPQHHSLLEGGDMVPYAVRELGDTTYSGRSYVQQHPPPAAMHHFMAGPTPYVDPAGLEAQPPAYLQSTTQPPGVMYINHQHYSGNQEHAAPSFHPVHPNVHPSAYPTGSSRLPTRAVLPSDFGIPYESIRIQKARSRSQDERETLKNLYDTRL